MNNEGWKLLKLRKGRNAVRLYNDCGPMPDIDYMDIRS